MLEEALKLAEFIASKSPVAVQATKRNIIYSMDKSNQEGLDHIVSFFIAHRSFIIFNSFIFEITERNQQAQFTIPRLF